MHGCAVRVLRLCTSRQLEFPTAARGDGMLLEAARGKRILIMGSRMAVFEFDPCADSRWNAFVQSHPHSSVFHTREWIEALRRTYRYTPRALTTADEGDALTNALVFCEVKSWLTGCKLVSLPFSDHCEPLFENPADLHLLLAGLHGRMAGTFKYAEIRPRCAAPAPDWGWAPSARHHFHVMDLEPGLDELYSRLHKDGVQRKIRRAEREGVSIHEGRSDILLQQFYALVLRTRRRHRLPPQPLAWFRNLIDCFGPRLTIFLARAGDRPLAAVLTLRHNRTLVYKYGCSDERFHSLGAMPRLFWQAIQTAKSDGFREFDLGRSDEANAGLVRFKDHLGAARTSLQYWQFSPAGAAQTKGVFNPRWKGRLLQNLIPRLPDRLFRLAGELLYRHVG